MERGPRCPASSPTVYVVDIDPLDSAEALAAFRDRYGLHNLELTVDAEQSLVRAFDLPNGRDARGGRRPDRVRRPGPHAT